MAAKRSPGAALPISVSISISTLPANDPCVRPSVRLSVRLPPPTTTQQLSNPAVMKPASARPGGGRVLGSAASGRRSLSPAITIAGSGRLSPSASSVSLNSEFGSLRDGDGMRVGSPASAGDLLVCPICSEEMVTLLQLNRWVFFSTKQMWQGDIRYQGKGKYDMI